MYFQQRQVPLIIHFTHKHATRVSQNEICPTHWLDLSTVSVSVSAQDGIVALGKVHTRSTPPLGSPPKVALETVPIILFARSLSTLEGGMSAASFLHSSFLQAINAVMLWPVHVEKVPQALEHLCPVKLQTRCDICCACQSICPAKLQTRCDICCACQSICPAKLQTRCDICCACQSICPAKLQTRCDICCASPKSGVHRLTTFRISHGRHTTPTAREDPSPANPCVTLALRQSLCRAAPCIQPADEGEGGGGSRRGEVRWG